jgi:tetratricopeptide (TPR) repeat protein
MKKLLVVVLGVMAFSGVMAGTNAKEAAIIKEATAALQKNQNDLEARVRRSGAALKAGKNEMAIEDYTVLLDKAPTAGAYFSRGQAYANIGKNELAIADLSSAVDIDSNLAYAYYFRGSLYSQMGRFKKAIGDFDSAIGVLRTNDFFFYSRGDAYFQLGDYQSAINDWKKARALGFVQKDLLKKRMTEAKAKL